MIPRRLAIAVIALAALPSHAAATPAHGEQAMVVTAHHLATRVGVDVLERGGNAVDAAVAVGYALAVVYPAAGNLGGGGFMTLRMADGRRTFIDFREAAPRAARRDMYLDANGQVIAEASTRGHLAAAVPGTVAGLEHARRRYGTMARAKLVTPAISLAQRGFALEAADVAMLEEATRDFRRDDASAAIFLKRRFHAYRPGDRLVQRDLAATLRRIAQHGADGFYRGVTAGRIARASAQGGGIITLEDLAAYAPREMAPVECDYRGHHIVSAAPPSSGGVVICEVLQVLEGYPIAAWGARSADAVHVRIEAMRHAFLDRNSLLGDPGFVANPVARLVGRDHAQRIRAAIDMAKAGDASAIRAGTPPHEGTNTTHYSVVDKHGNAVAVTYTLNGWFGARVTAEGTGVLLNNEMDDFTIKAGVPNLYQLVQGEANAIAPGKRPLSSMSPTIVLRDGRPFLVLGSPGGSRIISAVVDALVNVIDHGMPLQQALDAPRFHQQWLPETTLLEPGALTAEVRATLEQRGHRFRDGDVSTHLAAILVGPPHVGAFEARRNSGLALGY
jgi:gamma-glutamyltranspeptidase / glutathione hydrolase